MISTYLFNLANDLWAKKWRTEIIWTLRDGPLRFSEIKKQLPQCSVKVLSESLSEMEKSNVIIRTQYPSIPVKVIYELHSDLNPLIHSLYVYRKFLVGFILIRREQFKLSKEDMRKLEGILDSG